MKNSHTQNRSTFEIFPHEIFHEIFEYLPLHDLHRAFFDLNERINRILTSLSNLFAVWARSTDDGIIAIYSPNISRLVIGRGGYLNLDRFNKLRSLNLTIPSIEQCNDIRPSLILEHLHIKSPNKQRTITDQLSGLILTNAFPRLRTCQIDEMKFHDEDVHPILTVSSLVTRTEDPVRLLSTFPRLVHLQLNITENTKENLPTNPHINLRRLKLCIHSSEITPSTIEPILSLTPNLIRFTLEGPGCPLKHDQLNICSMAALLTRCLPKLRVIYLSLPVDSNQLDLNERETLKNLHPLFHQFTFRPGLSVIPGRLFISSKEYKKKLPIM